jgi:hypothetical protein
MSKHGTWTVIFDDNNIVKRNGEFDTSNAKGYVCGGTDFWNQSKFSNLHAIQFTDDNADNDQVEFKDTSPNGSYDSSVYGDFQQFIDLWDASHLSYLQESWDLDNVEGETAEQKITRLGDRPTSYSS